MNKEFKTIFLDVGGVLLTNGWDRKERKKAAEYFQLDIDEMDSLHQFIFSVYEIGKITLNQYLDFVVFTKPRPFTHQQFSEYMFEQSEQLPDLLPWLIEWKKETGTRIYSINNEGKELNDHRIKKFELKKVFNGFISSCEVGLAKPNPDIFKLALGIAQSNAEDSMYFDDRPMMAAAAGSMGIQAHVHQSFEKTKSILENFIRI
jgi:putative hydrolase of the HAD superfamily